MACYQTFQHTYTRVDGEAKPCGSLQKCRISWIFKRQILRTAVPRGVIIVLTTRHQASLARNCSALSLLPNRARVAPRKPQPPLYCKTSAFQSTGNLCRQRLRPRTANIVVQCDHIYPSLAPNRKRIHLPQIPTRRELGLSNRPSRHDPRTSNTIPSLRSYNFFPPPTSAPQNRLKGWGSHCHGPTLSAALKTTNSFP